MLKIKRKILTIIFTIILLVSVSMHCFAIDFASSDSYNFADSVKKDLTCNYSGCSFTMEAKFEKGDLFCADWIQTSITKSKNVPFKQIYSCWNNHKVCVSSNGSAVSLNGDMWKETESTVHRVLSLGEYDNPDSTIYEGEIIGRK